MEIDLLREVALFFYRGRSGIYKKYFTEPVVRNKHYAPRYSYFFTVFSLFFPIVPRGIVQAFYGLYRGRQ